MHLGEQELQNATAQVCHVGNYHFRLNLHLDDQLPHINNFNFIIEYWITNV